MNHIRKYLTPLGTPPAKPLAPNRPVLIPYTHPKGFIDRVCESVAHAVQSLFNAPPCPESEYREDDRLAFLDSFGPRDICPDCGGVRCRCSPGEG